MNINIFSDKINMDHAGKVAAEDALRRSSGEKFTTVSGKILTDAVAFSPDKEDRNLFATGEYGTEKNESSMKAMEQIQTEAEALKANMKAICNKMDVGDMVSLDDEGVDVNNTEVKKIVTVSEQIRIKMAAAGADVYTGDLSSSDVKAVMGEGALGNAVSKVLEKYAYPETEDNINEIEEAYSNYNELKPLDVTGKAYLLKNELEPTIANMYSASFSSAGAPKNMIDDESYALIAGQIDAILEKAGIEKNTETESEIKTFISLGVSINEDSMKLYGRINTANDIISEDTKEADLLNRLAVSMVVGENAKDTVITDEKDILAKSIDAVKLLDAVTDSSLKAFLDDENITKNLAELSRVVEDNSDREKKADTIVNPLDVSYIPQNIENISDYRRLQELRLMLTVQSGVMLSKNGIDIDYTGLSELVEELKSLEAGELVNTVGSEYDSADNGLNMEMSKADQTKLAKSAVDVYFEISSLYHAPCDAIGDVADSVASVDNLKESAAKIARDYANAGKHYEEMATEFRPDLGDRIDKAVTASTENILKELNLEDTEENRRAVRILAYNHMEINEENLLKVREIDTAVNDLFKYMTPEIAMKLMKEGVDVTGTDVRELASKVKSFGTDKDSALKEYSSFIYDMRKSNKFDTEEKEKMMGLYTIMKKVSNDKNNPVGALVNQELSATLSNLVTAYLTRHDAGMDMYADSLAERPQDAETTTKLMYYKSMLDSIEVAEDESIRLITENELPETMANVSAAAELTRNSAAPFKYLKKNSGINARLENFLKNMDSKSALLRDYQVLQTAVKFVTDTADNVSINELKQLGNSINLISELASHNTFYIPYDSDTDTSAIKLSVIEDDENAGNFTINMENNDGEQIEVSATVRGDFIEANIFGAGIDEEKLGNIRMRLGELGFDDVRLTNGRGINSQPVYGKSAGEETRKLFAAAKVFVEECR